MPRHPPSVKSVSEQVRPAARCDRCIYSILNDKGKLFAFAAAAAATTQATLHTSAKTPARTSRARRARPSSRIRNSSSNQRRQKETSTCLRSLRTSSCLFFRHPRIGGYLFLTHLIGVGLRIGSWRQRRSKERKRRRRRIERRNERSGMLSFLYPPPLFFLCCTASPQQPQFADEECARARVVFLRQVIKCIRLFSIRYRLRVRVRVRIIVGLGFSFRRLV